eukprot:TRINITY_DN5692_c0_g1_i1.p1 TRINITY_DN5692_c0_g1~~TRINITY_DN5692_c0_g1_i1.p1  ORF type:complete len:831 (-),score=152.98 TRINITY_DN5692_c0_g1_i1:1174-3666(-)
MFGRYHMGSQSTQSILLILSLVVICVQSACPSNTNCVSIVDYGASTTSSNNFANIQNAINFAQSKSPKWDVYVPAGVWKWAGNSPDSPGGLNNLQINGVRLYGEGSTSVLHGTVSDACAVKLIGSGSRLHNLRITSVSQNRVTVPWSDSIWVYMATNFEIIGVTVNPSGSLCTSSSSCNQQSGYYKYNNQGQYGVGTNIHGVGGIFIYGCSNGLVKNNVVNWTWADGIHMTEGTSNIRVEGNLVTYNGDDMIAVVSYHPNYNSYITVIRNTVANQVWGRALTVIGGFHVVIAENTVTEVPAAAVWIASEGSWNTLGGKNIQVLRNTISRVGYLDGVCNPDNSLPAIGVDRSDLDGWSNVVFADNTISDTCSTALSVSGPNVTTVSLSGNTFNNIGNTDAAVNNGRRPSVFEIHKTPNVVLSLTSNVINKVSTSALYTGCDDDPLQYTCQSSASVFINGLATNNYASYTDPGNPYPPIFNVWSSLGRLQFNSVTFSPATYSGSFLQVAPFESSTVTTSVNVQSGVSGGYPANKGDLPPTCSSSCAVHLPVANAEGSYTFSANLLKSCCSGSSLVVDSVFNSVGGKVQFKNDDFNTVTYVPNTSPTSATWSIKFSVRGTGGTAFTTAKLYGYKPVLTSHHGVASSYGSLSDFNGFSLYLAASDCTFVLYGPSNVQWAGPNTYAGTNNGTDCTLFMQFDGNLVLYKSSSVRWTSNTYTVVNQNDGAYALVLRSDGRLVVNDNIRKYQLSISCSSDADCPSGTTCTTSNNMCTLPATSIPPCGNCAIDQNGQTYSSETMNVDWLSIGIGCTLVVIVVVIIVVAIRAHRRSHQII